MNYSQSDLKVLDEIRAHLESHDIPYTTEYDNFCINFGLPNQTEFEYVPSRLFPMEIRRFGQSGVGKDYFYNLSKNAEDNGSFKYFIKDFEWADDNKREVMKSQMLHLGGKTPTQFYARDTEVTVVSNRDIRQFEVENCFYGYRSASVNLALVLKKDRGPYKKGTLVMTMTFGKNFFAKKEDFVEVFRVGTLRLCQVVGGASKLFKHFIEKYPTIQIAKQEIRYNRVVYYVDYDHGSGKSIDAMGFKWVRDSRGGFMNVDVATGRVSHRDPMHHKEIMERMRVGEVISVPNSGVKVYEHFVDEEERQARIAAVNKNALVIF